MVCAGAGCSDYDSQDELKILFSTSFLSVPVKRNTDGERRVAGGGGGGGGGRGGGVWGKRAVKLAKLHPQVCLDQLKYC